MTNNQIDPNQEPNQLSDDELEQVAGGGIGDLLDKAVDKAKDVVHDVGEAAKDFVKDHPRNPF